MTAHVIKRHRKTSTVSAANGAQQGTVFSQHRDQQNTRTRQGASKRGDSARKSAGGRTEPGSCDISCAQEEMAAAAAASPSLSSSESVTEEGDKQKELPSLGPKMAEASPHIRASQGHGIFDHSKSLISQTDAEANQDSTQPSTQKQGFNAGIYAGFFLGMLLIALVARRQMRRFQQGQTTVLCKGIAEGMRAGRVELENGSAQDGSESESDADADADSLGEMA